MQKITPNENTYDLSREAAPVERAMFEKQFEVPEMSASEYNDHELKKIMNTQQEDDVYHDYRFIPEQTDEIYPSRPVYEEYPSRPVYPENNRQIVTRQEVYPKRRQERRVYPEYRRHFDTYMEDIGNNKKNNFRYLDLILYFISGCILIVILDQFVKLGQLLA